MPPLPPFRAQLATLAEHAPRGEQWLHELKYDGYRIGCLIDGEHIQLQRRRDRDWPVSFPEIVESARQLPAEAMLSVEPNAPGQPNSLMNPGDEDARVAQ
jgi:bifunctional non-homologous end joining protein LigD